MCSSSLERKIDGLIWSAKSVCSCRIPINRQTVITFWFNCVLSAIKRAKWYGVNALHFFSQQTVSLPPWGSTIANAPKVSVSRKLFWTLHPYLRPSFPSSLITLTKCRFPIVITLIIVTNYRLKINYVFFFSLIAVFVWDIMKLYYKIHTKLNFTKIVFLKSSLCFYLLSLFF